MTDAELVEYLASEYGYSLDQIEKLTRREIALLISASGERKTGYKKSLPPVNVEVSAEQEKKITEALEKRFGRTSKE